MDNLQLITEFLKKSQEKKCIFFDQQGEGYVIAPLEKYINNNQIPMTKEDATEDINKQIAEWKEEQAVSEETDTEDDRSLDETERTYLEVVS